MKDKILALLAAALEAEPAIAPHVSNLVADFQKAQSLSTLMDEAKEAVAIVQSTAAAVRIGKTSRNTYGQVEVLPAPSAPPAPAPAPTSPAEPPAAPATASPLTPAPAANAS